MLTFDTELGNTLSVQKGGSWIDKMSMELKEASMKHQHHQKTKDGFKRLPEVFTFEDVSRCFDLKGNSTTRMKVKRLVQDGLVRRTDDVIVDGHARASYVKTGIIMIG